MPPTPQLDEALRVSTTSQLIGEFVDIHLKEQGMFLCEWKWVQYPCPHEWVRIDGTLKRARLLTPSDQLEEIDPYVCPCPDRDDGQQAHAKRELLPVHVGEQWLERQLAAFFKLDPDEMERERAAVLARIREIGGST